MELMTNSRIELSCNGWGSFPKLSSSYSQAGVSLSSVEVFQFPFP